tara:strand:- start:7669 stop:8010 length:342 start_codon:yes stop_codon:yes gene_type:complete
MIELIAKLLNVGPTKTDRKGRHIGNFGIAKDNSHREDILEVAYHFRYQWVQELIYKLLDRKYPIQFQMSITYNDRVWNRWKRMDTIKYYLRLSNQQYGKQPEADRWTLRDVLS